MTPKDYINRFFCSIEYPYASERKRAISSLKKALQGVLEDADVDQRKRIEAFLKDGKASDAHELAYLAQKIIRVTEEKKTQTSKYDI